MDSNIIAGIFEPNAPAAAEVSLLLERSIRAGTSFCTPIFCIGELWRVATEPRGYGRTVAETVRFLRRWLQQAPDAALTAEFGEALLVELGRVRPVGAAVFDVCIGVAAREAGADELWTLDKRFPPIQGLTIVRRPLIERL